MKKKLENIEEEIYEEVHTCIYCVLLFKSVSELEIHTEK